MHTGNISDWITNSDLVFPRTAKCQYKSYGPSGSAQTFDALCLLPLNVLNQKIFVIIWVWYICQLIASVGNLIYWLAIYCSQNLRIYILQQRSLMSVSRKQLMQATDKGHLGNYFVLNQMAKNTNTVTFVEILTELSMKSFNSGNLNTKNLNTANMDFIGEKSAWYANPYTLDLHQWKLFIKDFCLILLYWIQKKVMGKNWILLKKY